MFFFCLAYRVGINGNETSYNIQRRNSLTLPRKSKTKQRMVFRMIHGARIPDPTNGQSLVFWTSRDYRDHPSGWVSENKTP